MRLRSGAAALVAGLALLGANEIGAAQQLPGATYVATHTANAWTAS
jgi:hypothetical protein